MEIKNPKPIHITKPEETREAPIPAPDIFRPRREAPEAPIPAPEIFRPAPIPAPVEQ